VGERGATGSTGPAGRKGDSGPTGPTGPTGPYGPQGRDGVSGIRGPTGPSGNPGINGRDGLIGPAGPIGPPGLNGLNGRVGSVCHSCAVSITSDQELSPFIASIIKWTYILFDDINNTWFSNSSTKLIVPPNAIKVKITAHLLFILNNNNNSISDIAVRIIKNEEKADSSFFPLLKSTSYHGQPIYYIKNPDTEEVPVTLSSPYLYVEPYTCFEVEIFYKCNTQSSMYLDCSVSTFSIETVS
jgi:hypothetical protein